MEIKLHKATDPNATEVGTYAYAAALQAFREVGWPLPGNPDTDLFIKLWTDGFMALIGAWEEGKQVGVRVVMLSPSIFATTAKVASTLVLFTDPAYRKRGFAGQLMTQGDIAAKHQGIWQSFIAVPPTIHLDDGYQAQGSLYGKLL